MILKVQIFLISVLAGHVFSYLNPESSIKDWITSYNNALSRIPFLHNRTDEKIHSWKRTKLFSIVYNDNNTQFNESLWNTFTSFDLNNNSQIEKNEYLSVLRAKLEDDYLNDAMLIKPFHSYDLNRDGFVNFEELQKKTSTTLQENVYLPPHLAKICNYVGDVVLECLGNYKRNISDVTLAMSSYLKKCYTGLSFYSDKLSTELCLLDQVDPKSSTCSSNIQYCVLRNGSSSQGLFSMMNFQFISKESYLQKRSQIISVAPTSAISVSLSIMRVAVPVLLFLMLLLFIGIWSYSNSIAYENKLNSMWYNQIQFERWKYGTPLPPPNTVFIYWSQDCHSIWTKASRTCLIGQIYHKYACLNYSAYSRRCGFICGCQPLCIGISTSDDTVQSLELTYNKEGETVVVNK